MQLDDFLRSPWPAAAVLGLMLSFWLLSLIKRDAGVADIAWGFGFVLIAGVRFYELEQLSAVAVILMGMTALWGLRLTLHLLTRNWGEPEDRRYAAMRKGHGKRFPLVSLFTVFLLQGALMWFVSWPVRIGMYMAEAEPGLLIAGGSVFGLGLFFETLADLQLRRFLRSERSEGAVLRTGLWRYSRHPNYFGDACVWWGLYLVAASGGAWFTFPAPLLMTALLLKVSGVSLLEKTITKRRPEYVDYIDTTSAFIPWPPKR